MSIRLLDLRLLVPLGLLAFALLASVRPDAGHTAAQDTVGDHAKQFDSTIRPMLKKYCLSCHSTKAKKGSLDLERFATLEQVRKDVKPWEHLIEQIETGEMPPKDKPQLSAKERKELLDWVRALLDSEARARAGDPGHVPLRRLSNSEYDNTIRDLTGVDLKPTREFPADGAGGEGFTNAAEALSDVSPTLLAKYFNAAKASADHAVLLPDGFRFSPTKTRRDWSDEGVARLRAFYTQFASGDGRLPLAPYLTATVRHREALSAKKTTIDELAKKEKLNPKYLGVLWQTLTDPTPSFPLDSIRTRWKSASEKDVPALAGEIATWQAALWKVVKIGNYHYSVNRVYHLTDTRQLPADPPASESQSMELAYKAAPGQSEVTLYLSAREIAGGKGHIVWHRPRFERAGQSLLLKDYPTFGSAYEVDLPTVFTSTQKYLAAAIESANDRRLTAESLAKKHDLDPSFLKRWIEILDVPPLKKSADTEKVGRVVPLVALTPLDEKVEKDNKREAVNGWRKKGTDLPILLSNNSEYTLAIPGTLPGGAVVVHPTPAEFVAVTWKSPIEGEVKIAARIQHAHPACGNGVAWWVEHRSGNKAVMLTEGAIDLGRKAEPPIRTLKVEKGDLLMLAVDARDKNHVCDLTQIAFTLTETAKPGRVWDLSADVVKDVLAGNPHADRHGNKATWGFVRGPTRAVAGSKGEKNLIPPGSMLEDWREAAGDADRQSSAKKLAEKIQTLLSRPRPAKGKPADLTLYDNLVSSESPVLQGVDLSRIGKPRVDRASFGLKAEQFGKHPGGGKAEPASLVVATNSVTEVRLPAALFAGRKFVVEGKLDGVAGDRVVQFSVTTSPLAKGASGSGPVVASPNGSAYKKLLTGYEQFRKCFPLFVCFPNVVPTDEVVTLKMYHREDEPLERLFLDADQKKRLDRLWLEHRFVSHQPIAENDYLPQFIGFVTQDQPKEMVTFFEGQRPAFARRADVFRKDLEAAIPKQMDALLDFAGRAFRRPLSDKQKADLLDLYKTLSKKGSSHDEAFRGVLARVLVSPAFLFRVEKAPAGEKPGPVDDWELASRLSYFLTSSSPDEELRQLAAAGKLRGAKVLAEQAKRLLKDDRGRALAIEFGTQWIHVRGFDELKEKSEKLFPMFDAKLRRAIYEESILFFSDLFREDRPVLHVLDADATFLDETLARHYGIPGVSGAHWRRVTGIRKYGRGGILGLASVQTKQAGASRTSPVLRGNWVVETLLGEKLPRPPANVPQLPQEEGKDKLTMRQLVEKHAKEPSCASCHVRIDPFGFALERYDPIGRWREKDLGGLPIDTKAKLKDGTEFEGIDGLRTYLLTKKREVIVRLFCRKLLGYALGRSVSLSDHALLDEMVAEVSKKDAGVSAAVLAIVKSQQFRMIRGGAAEE